MSLSQCLMSEKPRHAAKQHAMDIIQTSQKLEATQPVGARSSPPPPPPTKFWPLLLVMAAIEVKDLIYREGAINMLEVNQKVAEDNYSWFKKFVEIVIERKDQVSVRLDWGVILGGLKDGLVM